MNVEPWEVYYSKLLADFVKRKKRQPRGREGYILRAEAYLKVNKPFKDVPENES